MWKVKCFTNRRCSKGADIHLFCEPRSQMQQDDQVWLRGLAGSGYLIDMQMTCADALELAINLLMNIDHAMDTDLAVEWLQRANKRHLVANIYRHGFGDLYEALAGNGADVVPLPQAGLQRGGE
jgi:hypothetical protein